MCGQHNAPEALPVPGLEPATRDLPRFDSPVRYRLDHRAQKISNASRICVSSLRRGHANLLCIVPILVYVPPKRVLQDLDQIIKDGNVYRNEHRILE